jgi:hypothetical protein
MNRFIKFFWLIALLFLIISCSSFTIRSSPESFRTGKVLDQGEIKIVTNSVILMLMPFPLLEGNVTMGLPYRMEVTAGWGVHGFLVGNGDESDTFHGPEIFVSKELLNFKDKLYLAGTLGTEINIFPSLDATIHGGVDFGWYPADWFVIFGHTKLLYHTSNYLAPQIGLGFGFEGPFIFKIGAYSHLVESSPPLSDGSLFWPFYYGMQIGFQF